MPPDDSREPELRDYLRVLRRRKLPVLLLVVVVVATASIASSLQTPLYAATAEVLLEARSTESLFDPNSGQRGDPQRALQTQIKVLRSEPVVAAVAEMLGYTARISARPSGPTDVIEIRAENESARRAADIANAYATSYIDVRQKQAVDEVLGAATQVQAKISELQRQIDGATPPLRDTLVEQQALFKNTLDELQVTASLQSGGARLVNRAAAPTAPFQPQPLRTGVLAFALGLLLGVGLAFLIEYLDDSIKTKDDFERAVPLVPVLGLIPAVPAWKSKSDTHLVSLDDPSSPAAEAYRTLRTSVQFLGLDRPVRSLQISSAVAHEGKTTTLANLAVAMAGAGKRVVLVCCDLRRPRIHEFFGLSNTIGFTSVLLGEVGLSQALQKVPGVERLFLLASGPLPPNPSELLSSTRCSEVLKALQAEGGMVLLDSPPVLPVTDGLVLSRQVDATLLVTVSNRTTRKEVARAVELLAQVNAPLVGAILNGVRSESTYGYGYGYGYYGAAAPSENGNGAAAGGGRKAPPRRKRSSRASSVQ